VGRRLVLTHHHQASGYTSSELGASPAELLALAAQVRARGTCAAPRIDVIEAGDLLRGQLVGDVLRLSGDAEALETLALALEDLSTARGHQHVPLFDDDGVERGELIVFVT
jgi:hypothetical protein